MIFFIIFIFIKMMNTDEKFFSSDEFNILCFKSNFPSQWYIVNFELYDEDEKQLFKYNCCEQRMMHKKALVFKDYETADKIMNSTEPSDHKKLGRLVKDFDENKWNNVADKIVEEANYCKFSQNLNLKKLLLDSGDKYIVECSPYDKIWGNGLNITDTLNTPIDKWNGTNRLGLALMRVRDRLK